MSGLYTYRWQQRSKAFLRRHPLCVMCKARGRTVEATVVDHVTPHRGDLALFWDELGNWQSLCKPCHDSRKQGIEIRGYDKYDVDPVTGYSRQRGEGSS